ncbi:protein kinase [Streptomyces sp. XM4193]|uniref:serine/threonine-protein kinase n=1 Tax=Streptomyces sp. XM4193 TaxID=2929782 RepID=UPI001FFA9FC3|nr:serine/threonine-protein kinase [Streptomyces sp. XM4193]MCK1794806.1 protein kinase [Streptomyces sp. XM4193]
MQGDDRFDGWREYGSGSDGRVPADGFPADGLPDAGAPDPAATTAPDSRSGPDSGLPPRGSAEPPEDRPPAPPAVIDDRYELLSVIGRGGMGQVWRAYDRRLRRFVAIKGLLHPSAVTATTRSAAVHRARREAEAIARIDHRNVVTVHDQVETADQVWIVMKLVEMRSLADVLAAEETLAVPRVAKIGLQVLNGLCAVHGASVVHRDVKPANILIGDTGQVILVDFGIATFDGASQVTGNHVIGTPPYLAPELYTAASTGHTRVSDLWALGVTLYEAVEGQRPFAGRSEWEVQTSVRENPDPPYRYAGPLAPVIRGLLDPDPDRRLDASAAQLLLREVLGAPGPSPLPMSITPAAPDAHREQPATNPRSLPAEPDSAPAETPEPAESVEPTEPSRAEARPPAATPATPAPASSPPPPGAGAAAPDAAPPTPPNGSRRGLRIAAIALAGVLLAATGWVVSNLGQSDGRDGAEDAAADDEGKGQDEPEKPWREKKKELRIGVKRLQPGLSEYNEDSGEHTGFEPGLAIAIGKHMGFEAKDIVFVNVTTLNRAAALRSTVDLVIATYSITKDRMEKDDVDFAGPYYTAGRNFLVKKNSQYDIEDYTDLISRGLAVCTAKSSTYVKSLEAENFNLMDPLPATYDKCREEVLDPKSNVYAVASDDVILAGFEDDEPEKVRRLNDNIDGKEEYGVAVRKEDKALKGEVCDALRSIMEEEEGEAWRKLYDANLERLMGSPRPRVPDLDDRRCPPPGTNAESSSLSSGSPSEDKKGRTALAGGQEQLAVVNLSAGALQRPGSR